MPLGVTIKFSKSFKFEYLEPFSLNKADKFLSFKFEIKSTAEIDRPVFIEYTLLLLLYDTPSSQKSLITIIFSSR